MDIEELANRVFDIILRFLEVFSDGPIKNLINVMDKLTTESTNHIKHTS